MPHKDAEARKEYNRQYHKKWYRKNREKVLVRMKRYNQERRKIIETWYGEYKETLSCEFCGESAKECLDFHHKDPTNKKFSVAYYSRLGVAIETLKQEIDKCTVLCANCHRKLHAGTLGE